jgi:two-component system, chemotaxis family, response regulator Rcp1
MHILLVEDNPADARLLQEAMAEAAVPAQLQWCATGEAALALLRQAQAAAATGAAAEPPPDLVLLDLNLPGLRGVEVLQAIKADRALLRTPVLVYSSSLSRQDVQEAYGAHANAYLVKPDDYEQCLSWVAHLRDHWLTTVVLPTRNT